MRPQRYYSQNDIIRATGLKDRYLRTLLDTKRISFVQPEPNAKRLLNDHTITDLEAIGIPVNRAALNAGNPGNIGNVGDPGKIRAHDHEGEH